MREIQKILVGVILAIIINQFWGCSKKTSLPITQNK